MIKRVNCIFPNFLKNNFTIKTTNNCLICGTWLQTRRRIKIKFTTALTQTVLFTPLPAPEFDFKENKNFTVGSGLTTWHFTKKKRTFPLRQKIKWSFLKFKYRGKGFKVKKFNSKRKVTFRLGKSHWTKLLWNPLALNIKRTKKNTYCIVGFKRIKQITFLLLFKKVKGINHYTKRGLRLTRQKIDKRFGKISQGMSIFNR